MSPSAIARTAGSSDESASTGSRTSHKPMPISEAEAEIYLARDLESALAATLRYCPVLTTGPEGRLAAIIDFTFNL